MGKGGSLPNSHRLRGDARPRRAARFRERRHSHRVGDPAWIALSRRKQGFESPRERHVICSVLYIQNLSRLFGKRGKTSGGQGGRGWVATNSGRYGIPGPPGTASFDPR